MTFCKNRSRLIPELDWAAVENAEGFVFLGCGGVNSQLIAQLSREGLGRKGITVIDPDRIEESDLGRNAIALPVDVGLPKVDVIADFRALLGLPTRTLARALANAFVEDLKDEDVSLIIDATDTDLSRLQAAITARERGCPILHVGAGVTFEASRRVAGGQVLFHDPREKSSGCIICADALDLEKAEEQSLTHRQRELRRRAGYLVDLPEQPTPMVGHLAAVIAGVAAELVCNFLLHGRAPSSLHAFSLDELRLVEANVPRSPTCPLCAPRLTAAAGTSQLPPAKHIAQGSK